ncbi:MAG: hypothetical protein ACKKL6_03675 [Candidatus Komeilibacteria bacterium]
MLNFLKTNWFIITICIMLTIVCVWLIKVDYFKYSIDLDKLLPQETKLSINLNMSELNTTINQKSKLLKNNAIGKILNNINTELQSTSTNYDISWPENIMNYIEPEIIYYITDETEWGVLAKANNKKLLSYLQSSGDLIISSTFNDLNIYKLTTKDNSTIYFSFINGNTLSISSSPDLVKTSLDNYANNPDSSWQQRFSIISLEPILRIKIDPNANIKPTDNGILAKLYQILDPVLQKSETDLKLEFNQTGNYLTWQISNIGARNFNAEYNKNNIADSLTYINFKPDILFGSYEPDKLNNNKLGSSLVWQSLTNYALSATNVDIIKELTNKIRSSLLIAIKDQTSFIGIVNRIDFEATIQLIYEILGKQNPKSVEKILPDGSKSYELIADESQIQERTTMVGNKEITTIFAPNANATFNYYIDGKKIIISTDYDLLEENLKSPIKNPNQCLINTNFAELLYFNNKVENPYINSQNLEEFTIFDQSYNENIVIKGCLRLK